MKNIIEESNDYLEMVGLLEEGIDGHAAVIMAHTYTPGQLSSKPNLDSINKAAKMVRHIGSDLDREHVKSLLNQHKLALKSSHPDALKNLHSNLMKVK